MNHYLPYSVSLGKIAHSKLTLAARSTSYIHESNYRNLYMSMSALFPRPSYSIYELAYLPIAATVYLFIYSMICLLCRVFTSHHTGHLNNVQIHLPTKENRTNKKINTKGNTAAKF